MKNANSDVLGRAAKLADRARTQLLRGQSIPSDPLGFSAAETNCGPTPCLTFDETDQLVSTTGDNAYASPAADEIRGPCPGLNAAANHGYLPRSGIASIEETVSGLGAAYNMAPELAAALAAYAIAVDGNIVEGVWSIGGPLPADPIVSGLVGDGQGISYSHNNYEGDGSIARFDAYTNNGDAHSLNVSKFEGVYAVGGNDTSEDGFGQRYTLDLFRQRLEQVQDDAIASNPYYFTGAFSTLVVVPAAYNFVINFMSNHTAEEPSGYLDGYNFKSFFGISGPPGSFVWNKGQERIPDNWYRRPTTNPYTANDVAEDVGIGYVAYPGSLKIGGNTGTPNSFVGVSVENLTSGVYNADTLFEGDNFACFAFNIAQQGLPDFLQGPLSAINNATAFVQQYFDPITSALNCSQLAQYDAGVLNSFPGYSYSPTGPDTNYKK
ncbi:MAG: hypothetical protein M1822_002571 [Bathelium mastoideum]|nr:MAG: hypothetical protein M1822_002571 [Bathelium mastoideum]